MELLYHFFYTKLLISQDITIILLAVVSRTCFNSYLHPIKIYSLGTFVRIKTLYSLQSQIQRKQNPRWLRRKRAIDDLSKDQESIVPEYWHHWHQICTQFNQQNHLLDWYNYRLSSLHPQEIIQHLDEIFAEQSTIFKLNVCFGFILQKKTKPATYSIITLPKQRASLSRTLSDCNSSRSWASPRITTKPGCLRMGTPAMPQLQMGGRTGD